MTNTIPPCRCSGGGTYGTGDPAVRLCNMCGGSIAINPVTGMHLDEERYDADNMIAIARDPTHPAHAIMRAEIERLRGIVARADMASGRDETLAAEVRRLRIHADECEESMHVASRDNNRLRAALRLIAGGEDAATRVARVALGMAPDSGNPPSSPRHTTEMRLRSALGSAAQEFRAREAHFAAKDDIGQMELNRAFAEACEAALMEGPGP